MTISQQEWAEISALSDGALKARVFALLQQASIEIQSGAPDDPDLLSIVPRLADLLDKRPELGSFREVFSSLARSLGLWNYIEKETADERDELIAEALTVEALDGITLHREQVAALNVLLSGRNLILSAPTSFGKSVLIDAIIASGRYKRIAIILPTIALLDEFRRRLSKRFGSAFRIVMFHSDEADARNTIFLGTQERLINRTDLGQLDLVVVDEFYKLDPLRHDERSLTLNAAAYRLLSNAKQFFFLGPNIESVQFTGESRWRFDFLKTRFATVAVDTYDLRGVSDKDAQLLEELNKPDNWPALIFISSPDKANKLANDLVGKGYQRGEAFQFANWIEENLGGRWFLSKAVSAGIGIHHGRIPRAVASHFIRLFNAGSLPILLCTSTLIEGVNTAAKSVLIYDKTIARRDFDFFTFSNIRGRAGRLGQHHVGNVFLFHSPPDEDSVEVSPPLFGDLEAAPDEIIVHISDEDASPRLAERLELIARRLSLTPAEIRAASSVGIDTASRIKEITERKLRSDRRLVWSGWPDYQQILSVSEIICEVEQPSSFGVKSDKQLAFYLTQLRRTRLMLSFFRWHSGSYLGNPLAQDNVFKFLRACEYGLPQLFSTVEMFAKRQVAEVNYGLFTAAMPRWFRPEVLKQLDEQGIPIQISERFYHAGDTLSSLSERLVRNARTETPSLSPFERNWITDALQN